MDKKSEQKGKNKQPRIPPPFHERFDIVFDVSQARERFVNRVYNSIPAVVNPVKTLYDRRLFWKLADRLGQVYEGMDNYLGYIPDDFYSCLELLEATYDVLASSARDALEKELKRIVSQSEVDLGIVWRDGRFWRSGAKLLDERLVNENLRWLSDSKYANVLAPFEKGLRHFLEAHRQPERLADTVTDMYEALEALAKIVTGRPNRDLSANAELFVSKLKLSDYYKKMIKDYIEYANEYRHATEPGVEKKLPLPNEVEAFVYTTGLFIRLAIQHLATT